MNPDSNANITPRVGALGLRERLGVGLAPGVATAVAMWILWWIGHLPVVMLDRAPLAGLSALTLVVSLGLWSRWAGRRSALAAGLVGGAVAALLNMLLLGSKIVEQPTSTAELAESANRLQAGAFGAVLGFIVLSMAAGALAGCFGRATARRDGPPSRADTLGALAAVAAVAFAPLIIVGGAVTSTESGMAVPDKWTTYGAASFLFPVSLMAGEWGDPRIFFEHTHRLFGSLVGLVTLLVTIWAWLVDRRGWVRALATAVFALVCIQGLLGALRVGENLAVLAAAHGVFGQLVFATAVVLAASVSGLARHGDPRVPRETTLAASRGAWLAVAAVVCVVLQLVLGALSRHFGVGHATWAHAAFAFVVATLAALCGVVVRSADEHSTAGRTLLRSGTWLVALVLAQFALGFVVLWQVTQTEAQRAIPTADQLQTAAPFDLFEAAMTTMHQTIGAAILAVVVLTAFWTMRLRARPERRPGLSARTAAA